jgi:MscS family membrane protein
MVVCGQTIPSAPAASAAQSVKSQDPLNRESPQSAVVSFLEACHAHQYERAGKYFDLRGSPADQRMKDGAELAQQLERILDRDAQFDVATLNRSPEGDTAHGLPASKERVDSFNLNGREMTIALQRVTLRSGLQVWLFSSDSLPIIPQLATLTSDSWIERHLPPPLVNWKVVDTALWRWIALIVLAAVVAALSKWLCLLTLLLLDATVRRVSPGSSQSPREAFGGPLRLLLSVVAVRAAIEWVDPSALLRLYLARLVTLLLFSGFAWLGGNITEWVVRRLRAMLEARHSNFSYSILPVVSRVLKLTIWLLAITAVLGDWGYHTTTILASLGVGGLAIALAAQKTIENLFGGVSVISDRPVSVGDFCRFGDRVGTVEDVGLRSTRIRTLDRTVVTVPNAQFASMTLENFSQRDKMWFHLTLNLSRETTPDQVRTLLASVTRILADHPKVQTGSLPVRFVGVGSYSLDVEVFAYVLTPSFDEFLQLQQDLLLSILDAVEACGTALALPTQASIQYSPKQAGNTPSAAPTGTHSASELAMLSGSGAVNAGEHPVFAENSR